MNKEAAKQMLVERVYAPVFVKACAERGVEITDRAELQQVLRCVAVLKKQRQSETGSVIKSAHDDLMKAAGIQIEPAPAFDPSLVDACLSAVS